MKFKDCIDFSFFHSDHFERVSCGETRYILCRNVDVPHYIDHQIENDKKDKKQWIARASDCLILCDDARDFIVDNGSIKLKNAYLEKNDHFEIVHNTFYKSKPYLLFFCKLCYDSDTFDVSLCGLINGETKEYIFIGSDVEHYFVHTNTFTYADSNGIANGDYFFIDPKQSDDRDDSDDAEQSDDCDDTKYLTSGSKPTVIIDAMRNTLEYLIETMK